LFWCLGDKHLPLFVGGFGTSNSHCRLVFFSLYYTPSFIIHTTTTTTTTTMKMQRRGPGHQAQPNLRTGMSPSSSWSSSFHGRFTSSSSNKRKGGITGGGGGGPTTTTLCRTSIVGTIGIVLLVAITIVLVSVRVILYFAPVLEVKTEIAPKSYDTIEQHLNVQGRLGKGLQQQGAGMVTTSGHFDERKQDEVDEIDHTESEENDNNNKWETPPRVVKPNAATARMEAQSSKWVDGEKALKKKLQVLYDMQQKGENLGVPVLTRFLGEDFPAWVEPGMDAEEWKSKVDAKYVEMRAEEEVWKKEMQKLIEQRERDIGITTP
jgi:hypothetical protein